MNYECQELNLPHPETKLVFSDCFGALSDVRIDKCKNNGYDCYIDGHKMFSVLDCHLKINAGDGVPVAVLEIPVHSFAFTGRAIDVEKKERKNVDGIEVTVD